MINKLLKGFFKIEELFCVLLFGSMTLIAFIQVIGRYTPLPFSAGLEEIIRYLFIWVTMFAGAVAARRKIHQGVDFFVHFLPQNKRIFVDIWNDLVSVITCGALAYIGYSFIMRLKATGQVSPSNYFPNWLVSSAIPLGFTLIGIYYFTHLFNDLKKIRANSKDKEGDKKLC